MTPAPVAAAAAAKRKKRNREKLIVEFDAEARREYLTGFSKRKKERRARALQQALAVAKAERLAFKAEQRGAPAAPRRPVDDDARDKANVQSLASDGSKVVQYVDEFSQQAFGTGSVTVTTTLAQAPDAFAPPTHAPLAKNTRVTFSANQRLADRLKLKLNPDGSKRKGATKKNRHHVKKH